MDFCDSIWFLSSSNKVFLNPKEFSTIPELSCVSSSIEKFSNDIYWALTTRLYLLCAALVPWHPDAVRYVNTPGSLWLYHSTGVIFNEWILLSLPYQCIGGRKGLWLLNCDSPGDLTYIFWLFWSYRVGRLDRTLKYSKYRYNYYMYTSRFRDYRYIFIHWILEKFY